MTKTTNDIVLRVYGLMRSGNHAIIEWLLAQHQDEVTCFLNNLVHGNVDPFQNNSGIAPTPESLAPLESIRSVQKKLLVISYEDREDGNYEGGFLNSIFRENIDSKLEQHIGASNAILNVLILRDPFNCFASRLQLIRTRGSKGGISNPRTISDFWKELAKKAVQVERDRPPDSIVILYNRWMIDRDYRAEISNRIGGKLNDRTLDNIPVYGGGSSFSQRAQRLTVRRCLRNWHKALQPDQYTRILRHLSKPRKKDALPSGDKVFDRWRQFDCDKSFLEMLDDEVFALSEELFGRLDGTEVLKDRSREFVQ